MKKLRLNPDELTVDSFDIPDGDVRKGTVRGRSGTEYTVCWGGCGQWSVDGGITCGICADSEGCTQNPYDDNCISYAVQCPFTEDNGWTCAGSGCTQAGATCQPGQC
jgi:hypothetical protein